MKNLKQYISEGLFDSDAIDKLNDEVKITKIITKYKKIPGSENPDFFDLSPRMLPRYRDMITKVILNGEDKTEDFLSGQGVKFVEKEYTCEIYVISGLLDLSDMFGACENLISCDFSECDLSKIKSFESCFDSCYDLQEVNFGKQTITSNFSMKSMFYECKQIKEIDFSGLNITGSVTDIGWLFDHCTKIKTINFGDNFNIKKCQSFRSTFDTCESLTELDMSKIKGNPTISNIENMLYQCENIDILKFPKMDILKDSQMRTAFYNMNTPKIFNVSGVKNGTTSEEAYAEFKRNLTLRMYNPNIVE